MDFVLVFEEDKKDADIEIPKVDKQNWNIILGCIIALCFIIPGT